ncbi:MAG: transposase [Opitutaceae bacterium]|nr:transposase [Opitutaceae bacterium]
MSALAQDGSFPGKLHHAVPSWVEPGAFFHVRIRVSHSFNSTLTNPAVARALLRSVCDYHTRCCWYCRLILLMPDHLHALLAFEQSSRMSEAIRSFKRAAARFQHVAWQDGYFDHRLRTLKELETTEAYIRRNPVAKSLCAEAEDWPWVWASGDTAVAW